MNRNLSLYLILVLCLVVLLLSACGPVPAAPPPLPHSSSRESDGALSEIPAPVMLTPTATSLPSPLPPVGTPIPPSATPMPLNPSLLLPSATATLIPASATPRPLTSSTLVPPTATAEPTTVDLYPLPNGKGGLLVRNYIGKEVSFTIADKEYKIAASAGDGIPIELFIVLPPGRHTFSVSVPGGSADNEIVVEVGVIWVLPLRM